MVDEMLKSKSQLIHRCTASESDCSPVHHAQVTSWILMSRQPPRVTSGQLHSVTSGRITHNNDREFTVFSETQSALQLKNIQCTKTQDYTNRWYVNKQTKQQANKTFLYKTWPNMHTQDHVHTHAQRIRHTHNANKRAHTRPRKCSKFLYTSSKHKPPNHKLV